MLIPATRVAALVAVALMLGREAPGQTFDAFRTDQIARLQNYVLDAIQPSGLVRDSLVLNPAAASFHPATPDAAGFALVSLAALDRFGTLPSGAARAAQVLRAYAGETPGVRPVRSSDGHFLHFIDVQTGADPPGWDDSFSPIGSALLVAGAQFAKRHFAAANTPESAEVARLADALTASIDFDAAIHPSLDGRVWLDQTAAGGGAGGAVRPWNEYQLVVSLALRQQGNNDRAVAVKHRWLNPDNAPKATLAGLPTLTDTAGAFAPAFWTQQAQFFNGDFRHSDGFQQLLESHRALDRLYSRTLLGEAFRYGLTAGVSPTGYTADRLFNHPGEVFSPEAIAAWGDLATLEQFAAAQPPTSDPRFRYGLTRVSAEQPGWVPGDAGLVDHLFLLFGLIESLDADFFADRVLPPLVAGDFNLDGRVDAADYTLWRDTSGSAALLAADGDLDGRVGPADLAVWRANFGRSADTPPGAASALPEPRAVWSALAALAALAAGRTRPMPRSSRRTGPHRPDRSVAN